MKYRNLWLIAWLATVTVAFGQERPLPKQVDLTPKFKELRLTIRTQFGRPSCGTFAITALAEFEIGPRPSRSGSSSVGRVSLVGLRSGCRAQEGP